MIQVGQVYYCLITKDGTTLTTFYDAVDFLKLCSTITKVNHKG